MSNYQIFVQDQALSSAAVQTLWQIRTGTTRRVFLREFSISFSGVSATEVPVKCEILRQTSSGTGSSFTPIRWDTSDPAAITTAATSFSGEPSASEILLPFRLTPNAGMLVMQYAPDVRIAVPVSSFLGLRCTAGAAVSVTSYAVFEE